jgi:hypothetical protein
MPPFPPFPVSFEAVGAFSLELYVNRDSVGHLTFVLFYLFVLPAVIPPISEVEMTIVPFIIGY